jgi:hypothetical protein
MLHRCAAAAAILAFYLKFTISGDFLKFIFCFSLINDIQCFQINWWLLTRLQCRFTVAGFMFKTC